MCAQGFEVNLELIYFAFIVEPGDIYVNQFNFIVLCPFFLDDAYAVFSAGTESFCVCVAVRSHTLYYIFS